MTDEEEPLPNYLISVYLLTIMLLTMLSVWLVLG